MIGFSAWTWCIRALESLRKYFSVFTSKRSPTNTVNRLNQFITVFKSLRFNLKPAESLSLSLEETPVLSL